MQHYSLWFIIIIIIITITIIITIIIIIIILSPLIVCRRNLIDQIAVFDKKTENAACVNVSRNLSRTERTISFHVDVAVKNKSTVV